jgi:hypothetical protein
VARLPFEPHRVVRVGLAGVGRRQRSLLRNLLRLEGAEVTALHDPDPASVEEARAVIAESGSGQPAECGDFDALIGRDAIDVVCIATPWDLHVPMAAAAMAAGKHVFLEVPAATTLEGCWQLVDASERTQRHCVLLENCCYGYYELLVLNMVRAGMFGEVLHGEAAYIHDCRELMFRDERSFRRRAHMDRDANLYPTHGLGPVATCMGINRGDRLLTLASMSSPSRGLQEWRREHVPAGSAMHSETYRCGDVNTSIIKTAAGRTIVLQYDIVNARPYDRRNMIVGTRGEFRDSPPRIFLDGQSEGGAFADIDPYRARFEHRFWTEHGRSAEESGGHGGMDFLMLRRLIEVMQQGAVPDIDVYDAAAWSAVVPLSGQSVAAGGAPVEVPDFTRSGWREPRPGPWT